MKGLMLLGKFTSTEKYKLLQIPFVKSRIPTHQVLIEIH